jgi:carbonic anhydrase
MMSRRASTLAAISFCLPAMTMGAEGGGIYGYDENSPIGPANWAFLDIPNNQCGGSKNSPIAVDAIPCTDYEDYVFTSGSCVTAQMKFFITNNGAVAEYPPRTTCFPSTVKIPGLPETYEAIQFHIHTSSEHTIDGNHFAAEFHVVHKAIGIERYAVIGTMMAVTSQENHPEFEKILLEWEEATAETEELCANRTDGNVTPETPAETTDETTEEPPVSSIINSTEIETAGNDRRLFQLNVYDLVVPGTGFYHYDGALTTPPCSEVVWWNLASSVTKLSVSQYHRLTNVILGYVSPETCEEATIASPSGTLSRPPQPLNGRTVQHICPASKAPQGGSQPAEPDQPAEPAQPVEPAQPTQPQQPVPPQQPVQPQQPTTPANDSASGPLALVSPIVMAAGLLSAFALM